MKYFNVLVVIFLISACSGAKQTIGSKSKNDTIVQKITYQDTIFKTENDSLINSKTEALNTIEIKNDSTPSSNNNFNHHTWNTLLNNYVSKNGQVNYVGFKKNISQLQLYIEELANNIPDTNWTTSEQLAYWINAYNALTVDLILWHYPIKSIKDIKNPWQQRYWKLGNKWYNLDEIEHQILRKMNEPRIHFAIVCASKSCPKLLNEAYEASTLEKQLIKATTDFLNDTFKNVISENSLELSKIFEWFSKDFKQQGSVINFINQYSEINISENAKIKYKEYSWVLNE